MVSTDKLVGKAVQSTVDRSSVDEAQIWSL